MVTPRHEQVAERAYRKWLAEGRPVGRDRIHWAQAEAEVRRATGACEDSVACTGPRLTRWHVGSLAVWLVLVVLLIGRIAAIPALGSVRTQGTSDTLEADDPAAKMEDGLHIVNKDKSAFVEWDRGETIAFGLEQADSRMKYLLVAAAALLGFLVKGITERKNGAAGATLDLGKAGAAPGDAPGMAGPLDFLLIAHGALAFAFSLLCGVMGLAYFAGLATAERFSLHGEIKVCAATQVLTFFIAFILTTIYVVRVACKRTG